MIDNQSDQLKIGAVLNYVIIGLNALVGLLYTPYMLHKLGQSEYGLFSLVSSIIAYLTLMDLGVGNTIVRYTAKYRAEGKEEELPFLFGMLIKVYCIIGILAFSISIILYFNVDVLFSGSMTEYELSRARIMILILALNLTATFMFQLFGSVITAYERFVFQKCLKISSIVLNTLLMIFLLYLGYKAVAMAIVITLFNVISLLLNCFYCFTKLKIKISFGIIKKDLATEMSIYALWIFLNVIIDRVYWSSGQLILGIMSGTIAIAVFALAIQFEGMFMLFSTAISGVFLPKITGMVALNKPDSDFSEIFIKAGRVQFSILAFILVSFIIYGMPFIQLWAGEEYVKTYFITILFFVSLFVPLIQNLGISILQARNQLKFRSLLYVSIAIISLVGQVILSKPYGAIGCAISIAIALLLGHGVVMNIYYMKKQRLDIIRFWKEIIKMALVPVIFIVQFLLFKDNINISSWKELVISFVLFTIVYYIVFWHFSMSNYEKNLLKSPFLSIICNLKHVK